ncbi:MAG: PAS domain S-box protein [Spirochaetes bacterium]|jgi:PAS domain S-box-containing protein|nr:PAS domain S-box protein [Spirochaetota bacterium]
MRKFIDRALQKLPKLDSEQIRNLIYDLANENDRLESVLDSLTDGVLVSDEQHNLIFVNKPAERLVPLASSEIYERRIWDAISDQEISAFLKESLSNQESVFDQEFTLDHSGKNRTLAVSVLPVVKEGHIQGNLFHLKDITERKSKEARLRRAESLASLTTLAAGVAHEIKNPLGSIGIHIQLVQKSLQEDDIDRDRVHGYIDVVNEEVSRLNKIVVDFLFAMRPMNVELSDGDLNEVVRGVLDFVQYELETSDIELTADLAETLPKIELDEKYLKQALMNIIKNAIAAMPEGGTLGVSTKRRGDDVQLDIADTGLGMSDDVAEKIFEPYYTTKDYGSGIGLTLVYKVIKEHLGEISVQTQEGQGTTFTLSFPVPQRERHLLSYRGEEE